MANVSSLELKKLLQKRKQNKTVKLFEKRG